MNKSINFFLNGTEYSVTKEINITDLINYFDYNSSLLVLEHNNLICNKKNWNKTYIQIWDRIEIVTIVGGG